MFKKVIFFLFSATFVMTPTMAHAARSFVDALDLSPFIPMVLDAIMTVATGTYAYFVENGIINIFIWLFLGVTIGMYLVKMYIPKNVLGFMGMSGGGEMWDNKTTALSIVENIAKPAVRALIAILLLLQIRPVIVTDWLINPFLQFGSIYTETIIKSIGGIGLSNPNKVECPQDIRGVGDPQNITEASVTDENANNSWLSQESCMAVMQPVADLSYANNQIIKRGFDRVFSGLHQLSNLLTLHDGGPILEILSGLLIVFTFVGCNFFMALLIIQAILDLGFALVLYPFNILVWVAKPSDKWFDPWPAFSNIVKALQSLVVTMIACSFILVINASLISALLQWESTTFVVAAGGTAISNVPTSQESTAGFGTHSVFWLSALLTFYVMKRIFDVTREQLKSYTKGMDGLYNTVKGDVTKTVTGAQTVGKNIKKVGQWIKKIRK